MKKINFFALLMFISLSVTPAIAANTESKATASETATESSLTSEEMNALTSRVEEIRDMDKSNMTSSEKKELKSELKEIKETMKSEPYIYIGGSTLLILIIVLIVLL